VNSRAKNLVLLARWPAKVAVAALLIGWLIRSGSLDLGSVRLLVERPALLALDLVVFTLGALIGTLRFQVLLRVADVRPPFGVLFSLQMTAFFFNVVIPGNIGGDVVKGLYVARDAEPAQRTTVLLLVFVERLIGVTALILLGAIVVLVDPLPQVAPLAPTILALGGVTLCGGLFGLGVVHWAGHRLDAYTTGPSRLSKLLNQLVAAARILTKSPRTLVIVLGMSMAYHAASIGLFTVLTKAILDTDVSYAAIATLFPLGLLTMMLPISPAGVGVGHVAFQRLFLAIGLPSGASIFNVYLIGTLGPCLLGVFPFLALKRRGDLPTEAPRP
jgi:uncharacterized membrane protein YbhN (UPF0104 family)